MLFRSGRFTHDRTYQFYIAPGEWMVDPLRAPWAALLFWTALFAIAWYVIGARRYRAAALASTDAA